jgi:hypothetical protein
VAADTARIARRTAQHHISERSLWYKIKRYFPKEV